MKLEVAGTISGSTVVAQAAFSPMHFAVQVFSTGSTVAVGSGKVMFNPFPRAASGYKLTDAYARVDTAGTTGLTKIVIRDAEKGSRLFSTPLAIGSTRTSSGSAVQNNIATNSDVQAYDTLYLDVTSVPTTAPKGLSVILEFRKP